VILEQHYLACLSHASYFLADEASGIAAVVDPQRDVDVYLERAARARCTIRYVLLTHFHADFVAGHLELAQRTGARLCMGARARADFDFEPLADGASLALGGVRIVALATPGHTPEAISLLVYAPGEADPRAVLTGDTLFVGDVGRPDLAASAGYGAEELAGQLYDSLHAKLLPLPDATLVYPAHGAGSMCGKNLGKETSSTIGVQRRMNAALRERSRADFVRMATSDLPSAPAYFARDAQLNRSLRPTLDEVLERALVPLSAQRVRELVSSGAQLLDAREPDAFAAGHWPGAWNIGLSGRYASWAAQLLDPARPIALIAPAGREREAALRLARVGLDHVVGYLDASAPQSEAPLARGNARHEPAQLAAQLAAHPDAVLVVDVREAGERREARIPGSVHAPLSAFESGLPDLPRDRALVLQCAGGYRSMIALSALERGGFDASRLSDLRGGFAAWKAAGAPIEG
jgi:glyoxylase-like metal-dependent hydrolase (beta-lactamase superfamily II)/rhodanese-related sulfurtransferase